MTLGKILRVIQDEPLVLPTPKPYDPTERTSGVIHMRDYNKEPLTAEELRRIEEYNKRGSGVIQMRQDRTGVWSASYSV